MIYSLAQFLYFVKLCFWLKWSFNICQRYSLLISMISWVISLIFYTILPIFQLIYFFFFRFQVIYEGAFRFHSNSDVFTRYLPSRAMFMCRWFWFKLKYIYTISSCIITSIVVNNHGMLCKPFVTPLHGNAYVKLMSFTNGMVIMSSHNLVLKAFQSSQVV